MEDNYKFKVNLGGMIDILSNHLYSSPNGFADITYIIGRISYEMSVGTEIFIRNNKADRDEQIYARFTADCEELKWVM